MGGLTREMAWERSRRVNERRIITIFCSEGDAIVTLFVLVGLGCSPITKW